MFGRRADATRVRNLSMVRRFMPFISPRRSESLVYFDGEIEVAAAFRFLDERNANRPNDRKMTLFHLYLRSLAMNFHSRPNVNRFTQGGHLWQRTGVWLTFSAIQEIVEGAKLLTVKREFDEHESLDEMTDAVLDRLTRQRAGEKTTSDKEMKLALDLLPPFLIRLVMKLLDLADYHGLLPRTMIEGDPMFTSVFVANLGSLDMDPGYHHLWEHGTCPVFAMLGRVKQRPDGVRVLPVRYTYDERIEDGLYAGMTLANVKESLENPEKLV
ncbi:MAG: hypothetical protein JRH01_15250 [Deltaproteobacteria bacterium]|nr:hypothetical protein [Deltaproteobacteria bacterium]MBW2392859.1 hypothetical protein [Deltaproteobacteria bacterium]